MSLEDINGSSQADGQAIQIPDEEPKTENLSQTIEEVNAEVEETKVKAEEVNESEIDQKLYDEVLEKLDIKSKEQSQDIQERPVQAKTDKENFLDKSQDFEKAQVAAQVENALAQDFGKIQKLMQAGLINSVQGQNLKKEVLKKAFDKLVQTEKNRRTSTTASQSAQPVNKNEVFEEFSKSNPDFFTSDGRKEVLSYLKSEDVIVGKDELSKISNIIRTVEKAAIDRYLKKVTHEKTLRDSNEVAKQRLTANAQKSSSSANLSRTFTREQIGKMSSVEFAKYESVIMENLKKGLIK